MCLLIWGIAGSAWAQQFPGSGSGGTLQPGSFPGMSPGTSTGGGRPGGSGAGVGLDDSTKVIYGPKTTRFFLESDIFNNRKKLYITDTALVGTHQFEYTRRNQNLYTDLGNLGTPMRPVFYQTPTQIGQQQGYYVFTPYAFNTETVRYYDTKSPFTDMYLALGARNQNILNFDFTQNISQRFNAGFNVQRFTSEKQFGLGSARTQTERLLAQNWGVLLHANYRTEDDRYTLLVHFNHMNHSLPEQGGSVPTTRPDGTVLAFDYEGQAKLVGTLGWERHSDVHIYQQYVPAQGFQFFHRLDYQYHVNNYRDDQLRSNLDFAKGFYPVSMTSTNRPQQFLDSARIQQDVFWKALDNTFGIKGIYARGKSAFNYRLYYRPRLFSQTSQYNQASRIDTLRTRTTSTVSTSSVTTVTQLGEYDNTKLENYIGGWLGYYFPDSLSRLTAEAEYLLGGGYRLQGLLESKNFTAGFTSLQAAPTLISQRFISNNYSWTNNFGLRRTQHAYGQFSVRYKNVTATPGADFWLLGNYVYFDEKGVPQQNKGEFSMFRTGLGLSYKTPRFLASTQVYYTPLNSGDGILRVPKLFVNARVQYDFIYAKVLHIQTGLDVHYKSSYYADAYMPVTQQYHLQNVQAVEGALLADVFANMRVNRVRFFLKLSHANQGLFGPGYYVSPGFPQIQHGLCFGVDWLLFD
ncbi:putative porin [Fibrella rubiginis]|uniref:putative porin n=1 Tax=Fibrella rubiginis TaxID=2817060 RepID=UPI00286EA34B|nr:putative porin [Fibrella rubiginis]